MSSYARSGYRKSAGSYRRGYATAIRRNYTPIKKMSTSRTGAGVKRPKFALAGYRKDTEKNTSTNQSIRQVPHLQHLSHRQQDSSAQLVQLQEYGDTVTNQELRH